MNKCDITFEFRCPKRWEELSPVPARERSVWKRVYEWLRGCISISSSKETSRFCSDCEKVVYLCTTPEEALYRAADGQCVALGELRMPAGYSLDPDTWDSWTMGQVLVDEEPDGETAVGIREADGGLKDVLGALDAAIAKGEQAAKEAEDQGAKERGDEASPE